MYVCNPGAFSPAQQTPQTIPTNTHPLLTRVLASPQRPLDPGPPPPSPRRSGTSNGHSDGPPSATSTPVVPPAPAGPGAVSGPGDVAEAPPLSERGAVRGLLQPLAEALAVLGGWNLRPPYVCGLDVWLDSPAAGSPGQALIMGVCVMGVRWSHTGVCVHMCAWKGPGH